MRLDHEFTVAAPVEQVWQAMLDPQRVAPCMPGATLTDVDGDTFKGSVKVKLGPVNLLYKGTGEFQEKDEQARKLVIRASGKDARGAGTASAAVAVTLTSDGETTKGAVATDLNVTGRPAQFGRGMISDVGGKILDSFAESLAGELGAGTAAGDAAAVGGESEPVISTDSGTEPAATERPAESRPPLHAVPDAPETEAPETDAIDLMQYAGGSVAKRVMPVLAGLAVVGAVVAVIGALRRNRKQSHSAE